jgi:hypothetical protein
LDADLFCDIEQCFNPREYCRHSSTEKKIIAEQLDSGMYLILLRKIYLHTKTSSVSGSIGNFKRMQTEDGSKIYYDNFFGSYLALFANLNASA